MIIMIDDHGYDGDDDDCDDPCVPVFRSPSLLTCWDCGDDHEDEDHDSGGPCVPVICFCRSLFSLFQINMQVTIGQNPYSEDHKDQYSGKTKENEKSNPLRRPACQDEKVKIWLWDKF